MKILFYLILVIFATSFVVTLAINIANIIIKMYHDIYNPSLWDNFGVPAVIFAAGLILISAERLFVRRPRD